MCCILFFSHTTAFSRSGGVGKRTRRPPAYLPLFRLVAGSKDAPVWVRWEHGARPLCRIGTREERQAPVRMLPRRGRKREEGDTRGFIESAGDHRGHNAHSQPQLARRGFLGGAAGTAPEDCRCLGQGRDPQRGGSSSSTRLFCQSRPSISTLIPEPMPSMATRSPAARRPCSMPMAAAMGKATAPVFPRRSKVA